MDNSHYLDIPIAISRQALYIPIYEIIFTVRDSTLMSKLILPSNPGLTLPAFYNTVMGPKGISFPIHLNPVATALADERILKLMLIIGPGSGKSLFLSVVYPLYVLGWKPDHTIINVSASESGRCAPHLDWKSNTEHRNFGSK